VQVEEIREVVTNKESQLQESILTTVPADFRINTQIKIKLQLVLLHEFVSIRSVLFILNHKWITCTWRRNLASLF
jgi:hypothetical protein